MLRIALVVAMLASSSGAYALNNNDLIQLNLRVARQQARQQPELEEMLQPVQQDRLRQRDAVQEQVWRQRKQFSQERYMQEIILEQQRQKDARRLVGERPRDLLLQQEQAPLFP